jgi:hypothetical protein
MDKIEANKDSAPELGLVPGSALYLWKIDVIPEHEEDYGIYATFTGTRDQVEREADRLAETADFDVLTVEIGRRGEVFPNGKTNVKVSQRRRWRRRRRRDCSRCAVPAG